MEQVKVKMDRIMEKVMELEALESELAEEVKKLSEEELEEISWYGFLQEDGGEVSGDTLGVIYQSTKVYPYRGYPFSEVKR